MKLYFIKYLIFFLVFASCEKQVKGIKNYGIEKRLNDNLSVSLKISEFNDYGTLIDRIHEIKCNDSLPKIIIDSKNLIRNIYPIEHCEPILFSPKSKHYVTFVNGKLYHDSNNNYREIGMDSLTWILANDFTYYRSNNASNKPESYLVIVESSRNENLKLIEKFLTNLTQEFDKLNSKLELNILFWEDLPYLPPPPVTENGRQTE
ncbi:hypothetical protein [Tamlana sp. I1]|uniref:hypothetical protein n=1 Tax=Tamlana sp. I1 TaxID=2762061 RepID=UPI00188F03B0|nr:hypothetical protein [Tamlana sp. I1]